VAARSFIGRWLSDERGATAIEYGLICGLIFLAIVSAVTAFGASTTSLYSHISSTIVAATS
jgi:pilus assembly protein Flp/PilA